MKKAVIVSTVLLLGAGVAVQAGHGSVGLGIQVGEPTGLTAKFWLDRSSAIDVTMGWNIIHDWAVIQAGYLYHFPLSVQSGNLYAYVGAGGLMGVWDGGPDDNGGLYLAGRIPLGLEFIYDPISFYAELDPLIELIPATDFDIGGGLGFRFYF